MRSLQISVETDSYLNNTFESGGRGTGTADGVDIVDAHVVICARRAGKVVVTNDPRDIRRIDPELRVVAV
ncbi:MAG TPA: hypothetical protein VGL82_12070 [Bryobacteraceae bacterium]